MLEYWICLKRFAIKTLGIKKVVWFKRIDIFK